VADEWLNYAHVLLRIENNVYSEKHREKPNLLRTSKQSLSANAQFTKFDMSTQEIALTGGNVNTGVVRVDNTVRRTQSAASPTIHRLLLHLAAKGFEGSPRFLGIDAKGREILTFFGGETGIPVENWQRDEPLIAVARMLRQYHDATVDFERRDSDVWLNEYHDPERHEVICHNDFAPYNFVYSAGMPYAVIDFDLAGPGPRLKDVAYALYWSVPLSFNSDDQVEFAEADVRNNSRRCRLFCETYGIPADAKLFEMIAEVLDLMSDEEQMLQVLGQPAATKLKHDGHLAHWQRESIAYQENRFRIEANLFAPG